jgi:hypothetical protein
MTSWSSIQASNSLCKKTDFVEARPDRAKAANPSKGRTELVYRFNETCGKNGSRRGNSQPFDLAQIGRRETALVYACCIEPLNPRVIGASYVDVARHANVSLANYKFKRQLVTQTDRDNASATGSR